MKEFCSKSIRNTFALCENLLNLLRTFCGCSKSSSDIGSGERNRALDPLSVAGLQETNDPVAEGLASFLRSLDRFGRRLIIDGDRTCDNASACADAFLGGEANDGVIRTFEVLFIEPFEL